MNICRYCKREIHFLHARWLHVVSGQRGCHATDYIDNKEKWFRDETPRWWTAKP